MNEIKRFMISCTGAGRRIKCRNGQDFAASLTLLSTSDFCLKIIWSKSDLFLSTSDFCLQTRDKNLTSRMIIIIIIIMWSLHRTSPIMCGAKSFVSIVRSRYWLENKLSQNLTHCQGNCWNRVAKRSNRCKTRLGNQLSSYAAVRYFQERYKCGYGPPAALLDVTSPSLMDPIGTC